MVDESTTVLAVHLPLAGPTIVIVVYMVSAMVGRVISVSTSPGSRTQLSETSR
jgi:hypothetical protein